MRMQFKLSTLLIAMVVAGILLGISIRVGIPIELLVVIAGILISAAALGLFLKFGAPNVRDWIVAACVILLFVFANVQFKRVLLEKEILPVHGPAPFPPNYVLHKNVITGLPFGFHADDGFSVIPFVVDGLAAFGCMALAIFLDRRLRRWTLER